MKDHEKRELVSELVGIASIAHGTEQLRDRIAYALSGVFSAIDGVTGRAENAESELAQKLEKAQMEIDALSTENGFVHQHAEEDKQELREQLEAERKRLDWALKKQAYYARNPDRLWVDVGTGNHKWFAVNDDSPRATIDELIAGEPK